MGQGASGSNVHEETQTLARSPFSSYYASLTCSFGLIRAGARLHSSYICVYPFPQPAVYTGIHLAILASQTGSIGQLDPPVRVHSPRATLQTFRFLRSGHHFIIAFPLSCTLPPLTASVKLEEKADGEMIVYVTGYIFLRVTIQMQTSLKTFVAKSGFLILFHGKKYSVFIFVSTKILFVTENLQQHIVSSTISVPLPNSNRYYNQS